MPMSIYAGNAWCNVSCMRACKILSRGEFVMDFYSGYGIVADESMRSAMLAGIQVGYKVRRIPCLQECVSRVGGVL